MVWTNRVTGVLVAGWYWNMGSSRWMKRAFTEQAADQVYLETVDDKLQFAVWRRRSWPEQGSACGWVFGIMCVCVCVCVLWVCSCLCRPVCNRGSNSRGFSQTPFLETGHYVNCSERQHWSRKIKNTKLLREPFQKIENGVQTFPHTSSSFSFASHSSQHLYIAFSGVPPCMQLPLQNSYEHVCCGQL